MNAKRITAILALACILVMAGAAQAKAGGDPIISIENGYGVAYNLNSSNIGTALNFTLGLGVADNMQVFVSYVSGDAVYGSYRLFGLAYDLTPKIGLLTTIGQNTTGPAAVAGLGLFATVMQRQMGDLQTAFKIRLDYLAPLTAYDQGIIRVDLLAAIGI